MKKLLAIGIVGLISSNVFAQQVPKNIVAEHFTNTYCSICAANNPGFYNNLSGFPGVLHIAFHPSAPYSSCTLNQHNKTENDARTNFYGVYGSTPRLVVQGKVVPGSLSNSTIFSNEQGKTTSFEVKTIITEAPANMLNVTIVIKKKDTSSLGSLNLYTAIVEDTVFFAAPNGENKHYDVFRKSVWGSSPSNIAAPVAVGDSVVQTQQLAINSVWNKSRVYAITILQDGNKNAVQATKSNHLMPTTGIRLPGAGKVGIRIYPNPANDVVKIEGAGISMVQVTDLNGKVVQSLPGNINSIDVSDLQKGIYTISVRTTNEVIHTSFVRN